MWGLHRPELVIKVRRTDAQSRQQTAEVQLREVLTLRTVHLLHGQIFDDQRLTYVLDRLNASRNFDGRLGANSDR